MTYELNDKITLRQEWGGGDDLPGRVCKVNEDGSYHVWAGQHGH